MSVVTDAALDELRDRGYTVVEGFLDPDELKLAQEGLWLHFPRPEVYFADPSKYPEYSVSQFAGVLEFPYHSWDINRLTFHPHLIDAAERYLATTDLHLYKVELWGKYSGAIDYTQPLHRDFVSHSLVVPRLDGAHRQMTTFIFLSDVSEADAPICLVPYRDGKDVPFAPPALPLGSLADKEVAITCSAGSLLIYRTDILHRGSNFTEPGRARFALLTDFQEWGPRWQGKVNWGRQAYFPDWPRTLTRMTLRERALFGFPPPGDEYWNEQTLADVALRYPKMDMTPYRYAMKRSAPS